MYSKLPKKGVAGLLFNTLKEDSGIFWKQTEK